MPFWIRHFIQHGIQNGFALTVLDFDFMRLIDKKDDVAVIGKFRD